MKFMENFIKLMMAFGIGLLLVLLAMPKVIPFLHKMKFGQVERVEGLESHKKNGGTPTMGGVVFVLAAVIAAFVVNYKNITNPNLILITIVLVGYSLIGFIDDAFILFCRTKEIPDRVRLEICVSLFRSGDGVIRGRHGTADTV